MFVKPLYNIRRWQQHTHGLNDMAEFFKTSVIWVVDFHYEGHPRRWYKALRSHEDPQQAMMEQLQDLYGKRATLVSVRRATEEEELQYLRGDTPKNAYCPTGR